jgi:hypothetical protein
MTPHASRLSDRPETVIEIKSKRRGESKSNRHGADTIERAQTVEAHVGFSDSLSTLSMERLSLCKY